MRILFEELTAPQRAGGIESATGGLMGSLEDRGVNVLRSSESSLAEREAVPDVVHFHGIWSPTLARRWRYWNSRGVPCVVSIHGMLEPWALAHKAMKKKVAWHLYQKRILNRSAVLHATSEREAENLRKLGLTTKIVTIPWGIEGPARPNVELGMLNDELDEMGDPEIRIQNGAERHRREDNERAEGGRAGARINPESGIQNLKSNIQNQKRTALFVGRIYPVKGLPLLVEAWAKVRPAGWKMKIVGPDEAGHLEEVKALVRQAGLDDVFEFTGSMAGEALKQAYQNADLFILPSHTENFGMVVGEAMSHGLPVITTHGAPWQLLETERCGWWVPVSVDGLASALDDATRRSPEKLAAMGELGREVVAERFAWDRIAGQFIDCYNWVLGEGERPGCVRQFCPV